MEGEILALDLGRSEYLALNRSGAALWQVLAEGATERELALKLVDEHGASEEQAEADVREFVSALRERGLLH